MVKSRTLNNDKSRMYTVHGKRKNMGKWMSIKKKPVLTFTVGEEEKVVAYITIDEIMQMAYAQDLQEIDPGF